MPSLRITDWSKNFENNRTREMKRMEWVPIPNRMDGDGYTELVDHPNGAAHFGAWVVILEIASRQEVRGTIPQARAGIYRTLSRLSRLPVQIFEEVIPRLLEIGWIENVTDDQEVLTNQPDVIIPQEGAVIPQEGDYAHAGALPFRSVPFSSIPEQETLLKQETLPHDSRRPVNVAVTHETNFEEWSAQVYERHPKKSNHVPAMQALFQYFGKDEAARALFDKNHLLWCASEDWRSNPRFVPSLYNYRDGTGFIPDGAWKKPPVNGAGPPKRKSAMDLVLEQMDEEERRRGA